MPLIYALSLKQQPPNKTDLSLDADEVTTPRALCSQPEHTAQCGAEIEPRLIFFSTHMPHRQDYSNVVSGCQRALQENNNTLVTTTLSLAAAQLVTSDNYIESPTVMTTLQCHRKKRLSS